MKKKFKIFSLMIIIILIPIKFSFSEELLEANEIKACNNFYNSIKNDELPFLKGEYPQFQYDDFGFYYKSKWDIKKQEWIEERDNDGNLKVGEIYSMKAFNVLKTEDSIIKINDKKIKNKDDFNTIYDFDKIKIELKDKNGENYFVYLENHLNDYSYINHSLVDFNISELNLKKGYYEVSIHQVYRFDYSTVSNVNDDNHEYVQLGHKYLIGKLTPSSEVEFFHICHPTENQIKEYEINDPNKVSTMNILRDDNDLKDISYKITPYKYPRDSYDALRIGAEIKNVQRVKNYFNLKSFPFDKQVIQYKIIINNFDLQSRLLYPSQFTYETLNEFIQKDDIPGWKKNSFSIKKSFHRDTVDPLNFARDGVLIELELERKHGYYIFKVILPIVLILIVCWSVVWIDPKEIEARLTITIVCLLSLIAYNFVIDEELPKLEYLTVMDWIVLTSYVYATIPNFLSIYSFKNKSNSILTNKLDNFSKKFGITSYILIIVMIIFLNANLNPDNSSAFIGWMAFR